MPPPKKAHVAKTARGHPEQAQALRAFNHFYLRRMGVLGDRHDPGQTAAGAAAGAGLSLTEARVLWELAHRPGLQARSLAQELGLNAGYISRLLARLQRRGLVQAQRSVQDAGKKPLSLTAAGRRSFAALNQRAQTQVQALLAMTRIRAGVPREAVDLSGLRAAHEAMTATLAERAGLR